MLICACCLLQTLRNNNSSRFGKWMEIHFQPVMIGVTGKKIIAAKLYNYLLESSRVTAQTKGERGYHIFYQLCAGLPQAVKTKFDLRTPQDYYFLNQSSCYQIDGIDEEEEFELTRKAMQDLKFDQTQIDSIWRLLIAILQIGNLDPQPNPMKSDVTLIANKDDLHRVTETLGLTSGDVLSSALCYRSVTIRGSISMIPLTCAEVQANRDALAKTLYAKLFDYLIWTMNVVLFASGDQTPLAQKSDQQKRSGRSIGILDVSEPSSRSVQRDATLRMRDDDDSRAHFVLHLCLMSFVGCRSSASKFSRTICSNNSASTSVSHHIGHLTYAHGSAASVSSDHSYFTRTAADDFTRRTDTHLTYSVVLRALDWCSQ
jgi:hypothetical protein